MIESRLWCPCICEQPVEIYLYSCVCGIGHTVQVPKRLIKLTAYLPKKHFQGPFSVDVNPW